MSKLVIALAATAVGTFAAAPVSADPPVSIHNCHHTQHVLNNKVHITYTSALEGTSCHTAISHIHLWSTETNPSCLNAASQYCVVGGGWSCKRKYYSYNRSYISHCRGFNGQHGEFFYDWKYV
jgi:hypothetical protein